MEIIFESKINIFLLELLWWLAGASAWAHLPRGKNSLLLHWLFFFFRGQYSALDMLTNYIWRGKHNWATVNCITLQNNIVSLNLNNFSNYWLCQIWTVCVSCMGGKTEIFLLIFHSGNLPPSNKKVTMQWESESSSHFSLTNPFPNGPDFKPVLLYVQSLL